MPAPVMKSLGFWAPGCHRDAPNGFQAHHSRLAGTRYGTQGVPAEVFGKLAAKHLPLALVLKGLRGRRGLRILCGCGGVPVAVGLVGVDAVSALGMVRALSGVASEKCYRWRRIPSNAEGRQRSERVRRLPPQVMDEFAVMFAGPCAPMRPLRLSSASA